MNNQRKRKPKCIVLDFDDTIVDFCGKLCWLHNKLYGTSVSKLDIKDWEFDSLDFKDGAGNRVLGKELRQTFKDWEGHIYDTIEPLDGAPDALKLAYDRGYKIVILTARNIKFEQHTMMSIMQHDLPYTPGLIFHNPYDPKKEEEKEKHKYFKRDKINELKKEYNIVRFVDDKFVTVQDIAENCRAVKECVLLTMPSNQEIEIDEDLMTREDLLLMALRNLKQLN